MGEENKAKATVYYDGTCPMCVAFMEKIDDSSRQEDFDLLDMHTAELPSHLTKAAIDKEIYVIGKDGTIHKNADAILEIVGQYPRYRFLVAVGRLPVIRTVLSVGYSIVAANRHRLFGKVSSKDSLLK